MANHLARAIFWRSAAGPSSVVERHIAGVDIEHEDAKAFEGAEDRLDFWPERAELVLLLRPPVSEDLVGKIRGLIKLRASEIEKEGPADHRHLDAPQSIVMVDECGDGATANGRDVVLAQPKIHVALALVRVLTQVSLDGGSAAFGLAFRGENTTMNSSPELFTQHQALEPGVLLDPAKKVISIHGQHDPGRPESFGPRADGVAPEWDGTDHLAPRPGFFDCHSTRGSPARSSRDCHVGRRQGESLGRPAAGGFVRRLSSNQDPGTPVAIQWVHGPLTVAMAAPQAPTPQNAIFPRATVRSPCGAAPGSIQDIRCASEIETLGRPIVPRDAWDVVIVT